MLRLDETSISETDINPVTQFPNLQELSLYRTRMTDGICGELSQSNVARLSLDGTAITNTGLNCLVDSDKLTRLSVWNTNVTKAGIDTFRQQRPDIDINF